MFSTHADLFFEPPTSHRSPPNRYGLLHLLRRDVIQCLGSNPSTGEALGHRALWPGAMGIFAGIDLMAKYLAGSDAPNQNGPRYKEYLRKYFQPLGSGDEEIIYQFRNSLIHSFGLYSEKLIKGKPLVVYRFGMSLKQNALIVRRPQNRYAIGLFVLHERFEKSVALFQDDLERDVQLQANFIAMFPKYGSVRYGGG